MPDDDEAAAFFALAHLAVVPPSAVSRTNADESAAILLRLYERNPDHPGAMHYLVHANDVPGRERELLEITRKYESVAPRNPHALHMPTHIYTRLGDWDGVIRGNLLAAEAALEHPAGEHGEYVWDEFPHAIEYLVYAYLQKGDYAERIRTNAPPLEHRAPRAHVQDGIPSLLDEARDARSNDRDWAEAASPFRSAFRPTSTGTCSPGRKGLRSSLAASARRALGGSTDARAASRRLAELDEKATQAGEELFARNIRVLRLEVDAWAAHANGQPAAAVALMQQAAELETSTPKHPVTPAPTLPAYELLGDLWMEQKQPDKAIAAYRRSLELYPNRAKSLRGFASAEQALRSGG